MHNNEMMNDGGMMASDGMMSDAWMAWMGAGMLIWGLLGLALIALIVTAVVWLVKDMKNRHTDGRKPDAGTTM